MATKTGEASSAAPYNKAKKVCCASVAAVACLAIVPAVGYLYTWSVLDTSLVHVQSIDVKVNNEEDDSIEVQIVGGNVSTRLGSAATWLAPLEATCDIYLGGGHSGDKLVKATGPVALHGNGDVSASLMVEAEDWPATVDAARAAWLAGFKHTAAEPKDLGSCQLQSYLFGFIPLTIVDVDTPPASMYQEKGDSIPGDEHASAEVNSTINTSKALKLGHRIFGDLDYDLGVELCLLENLTGSIHGLKRISLSLPKGKFMIESPRTSGKWLVQTSEIDIPNLLDGGCMMNVTTQFQGILASPLTTVAFEAAKFGNLSVEVDFADDKRGVWNEILASSMQQVANQEGLSHQSRRLQGVEFVGMDLTSAENQYVASDIWDDLFGHLTNRQFAVRPWRSALFALRHMGLNLQPAARSFGSYLLDKAAAGIGQLPRAPLSEAGKWASTEPAHPADEPGAFVENGVSRERWAIFASHGLDPTNPGNGPFDVSAMVDTPAWAGNPPRDVSVYLDVDVNGTVTLSSEVCTWFQVDAELLNGNGELVLVWEASSHYTEATGAYTASASANAMNAMGQEVRIMVLSVTADAGTLKTCPVIYSEWWNGLTEERDWCFRTVAGVATMQVRKTTSLSLSLNTTVDHLPYGGWSRFGLRQDTTAELGDGVGQTTVTWSTPVRSLTNCVPSTTCRIPTRMAEGVTNISESGGYTFALNRPAYADMLRESGFDDDGTSTSTSVTSSTLTTRSTSSSTSRSSSSSTSASSASTTTSTSRSDTASVAYSRFPSMHIAMMLGCLMFIEFF